MSAARELLRDGRAMFGAATLGGLAVVALIGPAIHGVDPLLQRDILATRFLPPFTVDPAGVMHWMGTDGLGRDLMARMIAGARISLVVGVMSMLVAVALGAGVGLAAAVWGGTVERILIGITDAALAMPRLVVLLALVAVFEQSLLIVVLVLGATGWMSLARLTRAEAQRVLAQSYTAAALATGVSRPRLVTRHVLPNTLTPVIVVAALSIGNAIMLEAGLSFLGLGVPAPAPSWGSMIASGREALVNAPWVAVLPGVAVVIVVVACNLLGDAVRDYLDPKTRSVVLAAG